MRSLKEIKSRHVELLVFFFVNKKGLWTLATF
jgi:hypothetical protein